MSKGRTSTWWRHDANLETDLRFSALRARLKADPYGLLCRLYDFCATSAQDGELGSVDFEAVAARLQFKDGGRKLRSILKASGYLNREDYVLGWREDLFRMFASLRDQNRERGRRSGEARRKKGESGQDGTEQDRTEQSHNLTATVQRSVERSVQSESEKAAVSAILEAYPRRGPQADSEAAVREAINRETKRRNISMEEAAADLLDRTKHFAEEVERWPQGEHRFLSTPVRWFTEDRFTEDPKAWIRVRPGRIRAPTERDHERGF